jgi:hypothetical protein
MAVAFTLLDLGRLLRCQVAELLGVTSLDLKSGVSDAELLMQAVCGLVQKRIVVRPFRHHQVSGESRLGGTHSPDVQVVAGYDTRQI